MTLADALANAGKEAQTATRRGDVVDQFHSQHRLADTGAADNADLAALDEGCEEIDDFDTRFQNLRLGALERCETGWRLEDVAPGQPGFVDRSAAIDRTPQGIDDAADHGFADRNFDTLFGAVNHHVLLNRAVGHDVQAAHAVATVNTVD